MKQWRAAAFTALAAAAACRPTVNGRCARDSDCRTDAVCAPEGYVPDGAGWLWAVNLPAPPMQASATAWPRPGRDSCNSRSAGAACP